MEFRMALYMRYDYWTWDKFFNNKQILTLNKLIKNNIFEGSLDSPATGAIKTFIGLIQLLLGIICIHFETKKFYFIIFIPVN